MVARLKLKGIDGRAPQDVDTCAHVDDGFMIGKEERNMGVAAEYNDKIYEIDYDNDIYDDMIYDDENLILL